MIAATLAMLMFLLQGHVGLNLQDEAFLWYGALRTHAGELPLRDFRAYDPGRYWWCSAAIALCGEGPVTIRAANWAFAALGLAAGLLVASRASRSVPWLVAAGVALAAWMHPPWKPYEPSLALIAAWAAVRVAEAPSSGRRLAAGVVVGAAAFFGRNLGVYAGLALLAVALTAAWKSRQPLLRSLGELALGTLAGYAPMLALVAFADGYGRAFLDSIAFYARQGALNAELPFPWPWRVDLTRREGFAAVAAVVVGTLFLLVPLTCAAAILRGALAGAADLERRTRAFALGCTGLAWFHHASVRSDLPHLAQSIHPFLLLVLCAPAAIEGTRGRLARGAVAAGVLALTVLGVGGALPWVRRALSTTPYVPVQVRGDELRLPPSEAALLTTLVATLEARVRPDEELWVGPRYLALWPVLGRRAPTWDVYPAWRADEAEQERMLTELADVRWALLDLRPIGGDPQMRLELSHPRVWRWILASFERVPLPGAPETTILLRRRS
ncbi:MAG: hypothetical protein JNK02_07615 [Planctomycetes bacterium]|nr:hypothetical protein [Planctomycetota bacterium]